ncbi:DUF4174 domain-containing protein [uncultured Tenacibaculum sp.]|uniref:DUF4174 domain-containing protein n=1 Tax=uncultured Tenacibaculum sp. TaxID=174713 RepID=UPI00261A6556|nr:DUF4174 domain-containing protein [uncultured Tenacibaculum sp.]
MQFKTSCFLTFFILIISIKSYTQNIDLKSYRWKNRMIVIVSKDSKDSLYIKQLQEFSQPAKAFKERKLKVLDVQKNRVREISFRNNKTEIGPWKNEASLYNTYASKKPPFKVMLIGLDGGRKKTVKNKVFTKDLLFTLIDGMPMRKAELKRN